MQTQKQNAVKPKQVKLWKNSPSSDKKSTKFNSEKKEAFGIGKSNTYKSAKRKKFQQNKNVNAGYNKKWNILGKDQAETPKEGSNKRKNESSEGTGPNKKAKKSSMTLKDRKKYRLSKKGKLETFEIGQTLKILWEELRRDDCKPERKIQLIKQVCELLKGRVKEFTFAHDTVRVLECVFALGAETYRSLLFEELKDDIIPLAKSKYGRFLLLKVLKYGTKEHKNAIMKAFHGKVISLMRHTDAAVVLESAFSECASATQRFEFVQEFYGPSYRYFKTTEFHSLKELFEKHPEQKSTVIQNMKDELMKVLDKSVIKHSIVHHVLLQFITNCDPESRAELIESLRDAVAEILHTRDGSRVAMHCVWHGTQKDRKLIIRSMKTFVAKIAMEEYGHMVLLALFDCMDDTKVLMKHIIKELISNLFEISKNVHGKKVLIYLLNHRDPHFIHPDVIAILKYGDEHAISKKDAEVRCAELRSYVSGPFLELIVSNIRTMYTDNAFCLFVATVLKFAVGDKSEAFKAIAELAAVPYTSETKNTHAIEHAGSSFMYKQLIIQDKERDSGSTFSEILVKTAPQGVMKSWAECNRGAFLLVSLLETSVPLVVDRVKEEMDGYKKQLAKKSFKGAEILLKKLKE